MTYACLKHDIMYVLKHNYMYVLKHDFMHVCNMTLFMFET